MGFHNSFGNLVRFNARALVVPCQAMDSDDDSDDDDEDDDDEEATSYHDDVLPCALHAEGQGLIVSSYS
eukprot:849012-Amphidinium_carterae.1